MTGLLQALALGLLGWAGVRLVIQLFANPNWPLPRSHAWHLGDGDAGGPTGRTWDDDDAQG